MIFLRYDTIASLPDNITSARALRTLADSRDPLAVSVAANTLMGMIDPEARIITRDEALNFINCDDDLHNFRVQIRHVALTEDDAGLAIELTPPEIPELRQNLDRIRGQLNR